MKLSIFLILAMMLAGCTIPQQAEMGANSNREEGFNGYGVAQTRQFEGPLSDLMVPDNAPKGLTDPASKLDKEGAYVTGRRDLSMDNEGTRYGQRILSNRPGVIRGRYVHSNNPNVDRKAKVQQFDSQAKDGITREIEQRVESLENVRDAHVITDGQRIVVALESSEQDRPKLIGTVKEEIKEVADLSNIYITTDRRIINRINALEHHVNLPRPFESIGGAVGDIADLVDDAAHGRR
ncbi:YhcN/YlaJ family sporulation lipoprotein [Halalkalibacter krulwichiae]|uniref:Sporulation lipoprotein YhcN/YlaJ (Spore_YhcN_YlaJ) n=1 Tax=Halalkalibacter krulwichiae TaxID=199441 RepID=A0A1X9MAF1_9BACI|nr:YhcN/YlaJ family sporulation lipoprotein [Halalkalibacter krulwichiae]ARK30396.1 Sporulation lipoprotein YhcN/YlaJ (Spore_YhcN_YlaJ) [Halalkalibacter krulwichiae]